ncbi:Oidioi.mRNA.OKI2018_I69.PAR.g8633.t1.cds [Oikopleura dioica]|uniref:Oidioi.mRNA.OKI2018_I69.PAR.g8633.t1.cds n=1 Tax=Oikopleura dioica TaxID=34765 RepID=A0ABN7RHZ3_OIKDI|nr:Oidioi.mRNA.OKI2018_I69.PAR.g8633.t1.cds [Oikopleura dioica]
MESTSDEEEECLIQTPMNSLHFQSSCCATKQYKRRNSLQGIFEMMGKKNSVAKISPLRGRMSRRSSEVIISAKKGWGIVKDKMLTPAALGQMNQHAGANYSRSRFLNTVNLVTERNNSDRQVITETQVKVVDLTKLDEAERKGGKQLMRMLAIGCENHNLKLTTEGLKTDNQKSKTLLNSSTTINWADVVGLEIKFAVYEKFEKTYLCLSIFGAALGILTVNCSLVQFLDSANFFSRLNSFQIETEEMITAGELLNETKSLLDYIKLTTPLNQRTAEITLSQISKTLAPALPKIDPRTLLDLLDPLFDLTLPTPIFLQFLAQNIEDLPPNKTLYKNILIAGIKKTGGLDEGTESNEFFRCFLKMKVKSPVGLPDIEELFEEVHGPAYNSPQKRSIFNLTAFLTRRIDLSYGLYDSALISQYLDMLRLAAKYSDWRVTVAGVVGKTAFPDHVTNNPAFFTLLAALVDDDRADVLMAICSSTYFEVINNSSKKLFVTTAIKFFLSKADNRSFLRKCLRRHLDLLTNEYLANRTDDFAAMMRKIFIIGLKSEVHKNRVHEMLLLFPKNDPVKMDIENWLEKSKKQSVSKLVLPNMSTDACLDSVMLNLDGFRDVKEFQAPFSNLTSNSTSHLILLPNLQIVNLAHTKICDEGLTQLSELCDLQELDLSETKVTDFGVKHLLSMSSLTRLSLTSTKGIKYLSNYKLFDER